MIIANPIYDVVFKRLMEDKRIAKFFIETLTGEEIVELEFKPQEYTYETKPATAILIFRIDFKAKIKTADNKYKNVLIEIQKAKNSVDLMRFRNYLAEQYKKEDLIKTKEGIKSTALPIITIYLLGFKLDDIKTSAIKVKHEYIDLINNTVIKHKNNFIENLSHDCYVVQIPRIQARLQSKLDLLLSVFEQVNYNDRNGTTKNYEYQINDNSIKDIIGVLNYFGVSEKDRLELEKEREAYRVFDNAFGEMREKILAKEMKLAEKEKALERKNKTIENKNKALEKSKLTIEKNLKSLADKDKALAEKEKIIEELKRKLNNE